MIATLGTLAERCEAEGVGSPAVVTVGEVASLGAEIGPAQRGPLAGRRVVVTRARAQASGLAASLGDWFRDWAAEGIFAAVRALNQPQPSDVAALTRGRLIFRDNCASCHGGA